MIVAFLGGGKSGGDVVENYLHYLNLFREAGG